MANPWDADPVASPLDVALAAEGSSPQVAAIAKSIYSQESGSGSNTKTSNDGAVGGMQVIPSTFNSVADPGWDINNPVDNARAGVRYVAQMAQAAGGDPALTAAGYYGGPSALAKARQGIAVSDPNNPNAPNTLQYGQQVASRIPQSTPQASAGNPWDNDPIVQPPQAAQTAPQPAAPATPQATPQQPAAAPQGTPQAAPQAPAQSPSMLDSILNFGSSLDPVALGQKMGDAARQTISGAVTQAENQPVMTTVDNAMRGAANGLTLGYADKAVAKLDSLVNGTSYDDEIAKERAATQQAGDVGKVAGFVAPAVTGLSAASAAAEALPTASTALRTGAGMVAGGAEGAGSYLGNNDGPIDPSQLALSTGMGAVAGAIPGLTSEASNAQKAATFLRANGGSSDAPLIPRMWNYVTGQGTDAQVANAARSADVISDLSGLQNRATQQGVPLGPADANALAAKYTQDATAAIRQLAPAEQQPLINALNQSKALSDPDIAALRTTPQGNAVADAIQMRQQTQALTAPTVSSGNPVLKVGRMVVNNGGLGMLTPHSAILGAVTDLAPVRNVITNLLGGRENRGANIAKALGQADNAAAFTAQYGPSAATQSAQQLQQMGQQAATLRAAQQAQAVQSAASQNNLANSVAVRQQQMQARQAAAQLAQQAQAQQAAASTGNLANSVAVRQSQAQARLQAAQQATQQAQAAQAAQAAASSDNLANSVAVRQAQAQARVQAAQAAQGEAQAQGTAEQAMAAQAQQAAQARQAQYIAQRQAQAHQARQAAQVTQAQATGQQVAAGDFSKATLQKPALAKMMEYNNAPNIAAIQPSLQKLAASDPAMAQRIGQLLTPGSKNLSSEDFYAINDALKAIHGAKPVAEVTESTPALNDAIRSPQAWASAAVSRQQVQKVALESAQDPDVRSLIGQLATTKDTKGAAPAAAREAIYNKFMSSTSDPTKLIEAQRLAQPLVTYGK